MNALLTLLALSSANPTAVPMPCAIPHVVRGEVKAGPPLIHTFELANGSTAGTLCLTKVEASCGCLRQSLSSVRLQPGERATLAIEVNTLTQPDGPNRWQVQVHYTLDLPAAPGLSASTEPGTQSLSISATLSREVTVSPPQIGFSTSGEASQLLTIGDPRPKPLTIVKSASSVPYLEARVHPPMAGANGARTQTIAVKLAANAPAGHRDETIVLVTDDPAYPEFRVPVRVLKRLPGGIVAAPDAVSLRFASGQDEVSALVQLRSPDGKPMAIASAESDHPAATVKWSPGSGPVATLRVTVSGNAAQQSGSCVVRVRCPEPSAQDVVIPVSWSRR